MIHVKFISVDELLEKIENDEKFILVEVLNEEVYNEGHIPGAINIPLDRLNISANTMLKKEDLIIVYCAGYTCKASTEAARKLIEMGFSNVLDFKAGKRFWVHSGLKLEK